MRILVAGGSGFIGKNLLLTIPKDYDLVATYHNSPDFLDFLRRNSLNHITPVQIDLSSKDEVGKICKLAKTFDKCVYLVANGNPAVSVTKPAFDLVSNCLTLVNLLEEVCFEQFIYFSSGAVYDGLVGPVSPGVDVNPMLPYAISNLTSEKYLRYFQQDGRINELIVVRFFGAYGPYEPARKIYSRIVRQFGMEKNPRFALRGNGENLIDAMYVSDTVRAIQFLLNSRNINATLDFYFGNPLTLTQLVKNAADVFNLEAEISYEGSVPEYIKFFSSDQFMFKNYEFLPAVTLREGLLNLLDYLRNGTV